MREDGEDDAELLELLDDAADGIDGQEEMIHSENQKQPKVFDPLAGNGKKTRRRRRQRKGEGGKDDARGNSTNHTRGGGGKHATTSGDTNVQGEHHTQGKHEEENGNDSAHGREIAAHAAPTKAEEAEEEEEEEERRRRSGASAAAAGSRGRSLNRGETEIDNGDAGGDDDGVQNLVKRLRQIQTDARSAAGDDGVGMAFGDAANTADAGDSEEALASMLEQLASAVSAEGGGSDADGMQSIVDAMMGQLLSKEVLYKPMMEIRDKYVRLRLSHVLLPHHKYHTNAYALGSCRKGV